jgi:pantothenate kinase type III
MARALHHYTARLPLVEVTEPLPPLPGTSTATAIAAGVQGAVAGGIGYLVERLIFNFLDETRLEPLLFLTGGDAALLAPALEPAVKRLKIEMVVWPWMTLEGIRLTAARHLRNDT